MLPLPPDSLQHFGHSLPLCSIVVLRLLNLCVMMLSSLVWFAFQMQMAMGSVLIAALASVRSDGGGRTFCLSPSGNRQLPTGGPLPGLSPIGQPMPKALFRFQILPPNLLCKIPIPVTSKCRHIYGVLNVDEIKN
jgi:hypothetical protein